jgi:hypothetical protein
VDTTSHGLVELAMVLARPAVEGSTLSPVSAWVIARDSNAALGVPHAAMSGARSQFAPRINPRATMAGVRESPTPKRYPGVSAIREVPASKLHLCVAAIWEAPAPPSAICALLPSGRRPPPSAI